MLDAGVPRLLRRGMDRAEVAGEVDLLVVGEFLVVEHHDRIAVDRVLDGVAIGGLQRLREVDAGDLGDEIGVVGVTVMLMTASCGYSGGPAIFPQETPCRKRSSSPCSTIIRR